MKEINHLRSTAHPIRLRILSLLTGENLTQGELAKLLGKSQGVIGYHLQGLIEAGKVSVAGKKIVRGGEATIYKYNLSSTRSRNKSTQKVQIQALAHELIRRSSSFENGNQVFSDLEFWVSEENWTKAVSQIYEILENLHKVALPSKQEKSLRASLSVALFQVKKS